MWSFSRIIGNPMRSCLLFDLDGTLFDTREANVAAYADAFQAAGVSFNDAAYRQHFGLRFNEMMAAIAPNIPTAKKAEIRQQKSRYYRKHLDKITPNSGLIGLVKAAAGRFRTGLVTTASRHNVELILGQFELGDDDFDVIITGEDVQQSKPHPECYRRAMQKLGFPPHEVIIFEDSDSGLTAARAAGAHVVRVII